MITDHRLQPLAVFPFHAGVLREGDFQIVEGASSSITEARPSALAQLKSEHPTPEARSFLPELASHPALAEKRRRRIPVIAALLATAAAILLAAFLFNRSRTPHPPRLPAVTAMTPPVKATTPAATKQQPVQNTAVLFNVERREGTAILSWNHEAPAVKDADYALLIIEDGEDGRNRQELRLNRTDLETGRLVYIPRRRDVNFQLKLFAQSHATESIRSVADLPQTQPARTADANKRSLSETDEPTPPPTVRIFAQNAAPATPEPAAPAAAPANTPPSAEENKPGPFPAVPAAPQPDQTPPKPREPGVVTTVSLEPLGPSGIRRILGSHSGNKQIPPHALSPILPAPRGC